MGTYTRYIVWVKGSWCIPYKRLQSQLYNTPSFWTPDPIVCSQHPPTFLFIRILLGKRTPYCMQAHVFAAKTLTANTSYVTGIQVHTTAFECSKAEPQYFSHIQIGRDDLQDERKRLKNTWRQASNALSQKCQDSHKKVDLPKERIFRRFPPTLGTN